ncbi:MAG: hypothetical protein KFF73_11250 [Cyclobacteriaceae bacterium]|nr:hypothetical protein [Cyclobacteriaceae bacterium]
MENKVKTHPAKKVDEYLRRYHGPVSDLLEGIQRIRAWQMTSGFSTKYLKV